MVRAWGGSRVFSSCRPLRSVPGHDLGNRAAKLGRTTFMFFAFVSFTSCRTPPPSGPGAFWDFLPLGMWHRIVLLFFSFSAVQFLLAPLAAVVALLWVFVFPPTRFRPAPPFQVIWRWFSLTFFLSRTDGPPFFPFVLGVPYRLRGLAVQSCGGGVLRSRIYLRLI